MGDQRRKRRIQVRIRTMEGVKPDTVWTWNAIGKRARRLEPRRRTRPRARQGFLLNHLIAEPPAADAEGPRRSTPIR